MEKEIIEVKNVEIYEYCLLNRKTGYKEFLDQATAKGFKGSYFKDINNFFAIFPTEDGPKVFYKEHEYEINKELTITLEKVGKDRKFKISDYNIEVNYIESPYIGFDSWSDEIDVDLFFMIEQSYKAQSFYDKFTLKSV